MFPKIPRAGAINDPIMEMMAEETWGGQAQLELNPNPSFSASLTTILCSTITLQEKEQ